MAVKNQTQRIELLEQQVSELLAGQTAMLQGQVQVEVRLFSSPAPNCRARTTLKSFLLSHKSAPWLVVDGEEWLRLVGRRVAGGGNVVRRRRS